MRNGFPWWLPLVTTAAAVLIAVLVSRSVDASWEARVRLWASDERPPAEYAAILRDPALVEIATSTMMSSETGVPRLSELSVELRDTLIVLTVRAGQPGDAESLAFGIADAAAEAADAKFPGDSGLQVLGLAEPDARRAAPQTERNGAIAAAVGLIAGFILATGLARPARSMAPESSLGRIGRVGLRTIAVLPRQSRQPLSRDGTPPPSALQLADALDLIDRSTASVTAFVPIDESVDALEPATQSARALAGRDHSVLWLDARRPAFQLEITVPPPLWLSGTTWTPIPRSEMIRRALEFHGRQPQHVILLSPELIDPEALVLCGFCDRVVLVALANTPATQLYAARIKLRHSRLIGVALTNAEPRDTDAFTLAQAPD